jgi:spore coat protein U-like protein
MRSLIKYPVFIFLLFFFNSYGYAVTCQVFMNTSMVFENYNPTVAANYDTKTSIRIFCKPEGSRGLATIKVKTVGSSEGSDFRIMKNSKNESLKFNLYQDQNFSKIIDNNTIIFRTTGFFNTERDFEILIYGKILPFQNIGVGNYQMNLPILVEWNNGPN